MNPLDVKKNNCTVYVSSQYTKGFAMEGMNHKAPGQSLPKTTLGWDTG